jgi:type I restriction enzyme S subunit
LPSFEEQKRIELALNAADSHIKREQGGLAKLKGQKLGLMQDLLTGKVPVKVGAGGTANG